jgi:hypothetical protein
MPLLSKVLALHLVELPVHVDGTNVDRTASGGASIIVGAVTRAACVPQVERSCTVDLTGCQRMSVLQSNGARPTAEVRKRWQSTHRSTVCLCRNRQSRGRSQWADRQSHCVERFRGFDGATGSTGHSTADGKIKAARCGAVGWRESADKSGTSDSVRQDRTACGFAQLAGKSILYALCVHPRHDQRR